ncbi:hypothetical protein E5Q_06747 [Mixia osmundae IAM 14324]|uniref:Uncharacterized protein n=1 Tax=Mixia osmundae (strain CBS 9802 / IAM 14324 / JCM 22182 / KY 12970) TaxID=764103 RepID=G7EB34_MIXOS|nr:hypothetical protein E5Q_06747 [Mixia osmundae IAM 14324]
MHLHCLAFRSRQASQIMLPRTPFPADFVCEWVEHQPLPATALSVVT